MTCGNKHVMNPDQHWFLWDTVGHSRRRKLKTCNYIFLWGFCSDSEIFIKAHCSQCSYHVQLPRACTYSSSGGSSFVLWSSFLLLSRLIFVAHWSWFPPKHQQAAMAGWNCSYTAPQLGDILSHPREQMPIKSNSGVLPVWKTVLSLPYFPYCYGIIDEEKPTHAGCSQKQLILQATAHAWPFNHS